MNLLVQACFSKRQKISLYVGFCFQKIEYSVYFFILCIHSSITNNVYLCWLPKSEMDILGVMLIDLESWDDI